MFFETRCGGCGQVGVELCRRCRSRLRSWQPSGAEKRRYVSVTGLDGFTAGYSYDRHVGRVIISAKNGPRPHLLDRLAVEVGERLLPQLRPGRSFDVVTWVPASAGRRRSRGLDQGQVIAKRAALLVGSQERRMFRRARGEAQEGRGRAARLLGPTLTARSRSPRSVLLIDDVATTGATLGAATSLLREVGAEEVWALVLAAG